jgi:hypothetical protein
MTKKLQQGLPPFGRACQVNQMAGIAFSLEEPAEAQSDICPRLLTPSNALEQGGTRRQAVLSPLSLSLSFFRATSATNPASHHQYLRWILLSPLSPHSSTDLDLKSRSTGVEVITENDFPFLLDYICSKWLYSHMLQGGRYKGQLGTAS